jgi:alkylation response protein AidB-like acyl-CoA dehydrogenase
MGGITRWRHIVDEYAGLPAVECPRNVVGRQLFLGLFWRQQAGCTPFCFPPAPRRAGFGEIFEGVLEIHKLVIARGVLGMQ